MESAKRAAEDFARSHHASKKPKFDLRNPSALAPDAPEQDAILDADVIGARGQQTRRTGVNIDGYDSDSENENFDQRARRKADAERQSKDEEQEDMFADLEEDFRDNDGDERKKKEVKFLGDGQIEGEVKDSTSGGHVSADFSLGGKGKGKDKESGSESESEVDDETRAMVASEMDEELGAGSKKKHAPKLDAFNMRTENEEGAFDESGNYVRKAVDPDEKYDNWLDGITSKEIKKAKESKEKRAQEERERREEQEREDGEKSLPQMLSLLIRFLQPRENPTQALGRLEKSRQQLESRKRKQKISKKSKYSGWSKKKKQEQHETHADDVTDANADEQAELEALEQQIKLAAESIVDAATWLDNGRVRDAYQARLEFFIDQYADETGKEWVDTDQTISTMHNASG